MPIFEQLNIYLFKTQKCQIKVYHQHKTCPFFHHQKDQRRQLIDQNNQNILNEKYNYTGDLCQIKQCPYNPLNQLDIKDEQSDQKKEQSNNQYNLDQSQDEIEIKMTSSNQNLSQNNNQSQNNIICGLNCDKSRNLIEQLYHPEKYKKKFCSFYPDELMKCEYDQYCSFAHSEQELKIDLIHYYEMDADFFIFNYKTQWCPFNSSIHGKSKCVYAHNWQDYRRKISIIKYSNESCPFWSNVDFITSYNDGCPQGKDCLKSHGWKESHYHPLNYKVRLCLQEKKCPRENNCPFYHDQSDQRIISQNITNNVFEFVPRNRLAQIMQCLQDKQNLNSQSSSSQSKYIKKNFSDQKQNIFEQFCQKNNGFKINLPPGLINPNIVITSINDQYQRQNNKQNNHKIMNSQQLNNMMIQNVNEPNLFDKESKKKLINSCNLNFGNQQINQETNQDDQFDWIQTKPIKNKNYNQIVNSCDNSSQQSNQQNENSTSNHNKKQKFGLCNKSIESQIVENSEESDLSKKEDLNRPIVIISQNIKK